MKKFFTVFLVMSVFTGVVFAQPFSNFRNLPLKANISNFKPKSSNTKVSRWYNYAATIQKINFTSSTDANLNNIALFPDTTCIVKYTSSNGTHTYAGPWFHSIGVALDPADTIFYDATASLNITRPLPTYPPNHPVDTTQSFSYNIDSIGIPGGYFRNLKNPAIVDTLEVEMISNVRNDDIYHFVGVGNQTQYWNAYTTYFMGFKFDANMNFIKPDASVGYQVIKIPLTVKDSSKITNNSYHIKEKYGVTKTPLPYGRGIVAATIRFIPGYSWQPTDSLYHLNYFCFLAYEEKGAGVNINPRYDSLYFNESEYMTTQTLEKGSWHGMYSPRLAYSNTSPLDNVLLDLRVTNTYSSPTATISGATRVCQYAAEPNITFTGAGGLPPYTFTYTINGGAVKQIPTTSGISVTVAVPTGSTGSYIYSLVSVSDKNGNSQAESGSATVIVNPLPTATISGTTTVCQNTASPYITFTGTTGTAPYTFIYKINGGFNRQVSTTYGNTASVSVPTGTIGSFDYSLVSVSDNNGCSEAQSGSATITVNKCSNGCPYIYTQPQPSIVCYYANASASFSISTSNSSSLTFQWLYSINGGSSYNSIGTNDSILKLTSISLNMNNYLYECVVNNAGSTCPTTSSPAILTVSLPSVVIIGATTVCQNAASPDITFIGESGTAPYTFIYQINGGATQKVSTTSGDLVKVAVPTSTVGSFVYSLVSVTDKNGCSQAQSESATVIVNPLPSAAISGTTSVCQNAVSPNITFKGAAGTAPYTFTYTINGGASKQITTSSGNSVTVAVPTGTVGGYVYSLVSVSDNNGCSQAQSMSATVTVNKCSQGCPYIYTQPQSSIICSNANASFNISTSNSSSLTFQWLFSKDGGITYNFIGANDSILDISSVTSSMNGYIYKCVVNNSSGTCPTTSSTATLTVNSYPNSPLVTSPVSYCLNAIPSLLTATGSNLLWYTTATGGTGNANAPTPSTKNAGTTFYYVSQTINGCESQRAQILVIINPLPVTPTITQLGNILLSSSENGNQWYDQHGIINGATDSLLVITKGGKYYVIVTKNGCQSDTSNIITIAGIENLNNEQYLNIYPNPANSFIVVSYSLIENSPVNINIYDITGRAIADIINENQGKGEHDIKVNTLKLTEGVYILKFSTTNLIGTKKIVVWH